MNREYIDPELAAIFLRVNINTLRKWRSKSIGPLYQKNGRFILYRVSEIHRWLLSRSWHEVVVEYEENYGPDGRTVLARSEKCYETD